MSRANRKAKSSWFAVAATACITHTLGCSALFTTAPPGATDPPVPLDQPVPCSGSVAPPLVDTAVAALQAARVVYAAQAKDYEYRDYPINRTADLSIGAGLLTVFTISAFYGFATTSECREAKRSHARKRLEWQRQQQPGPVPRSMPPPVQDAPGGSLSPAPWAEPTAPPAHGQDPELQRNAPF